MAAMQGKPRPKRGETEKIKPILDNSSLSRGSNANLREIIFALKVEPRPFALTFSGLNKKITDMRENGPA